MTTYDVRIRDQASGPAGNIADAVRAMRNGVAGAARELKNLGSSMARTRGQMAGAAQSARAMAASMTQQSAASKRWQSNVQKHTVRLNETAMALKRTGSATTSMGSAAGDASGMLGQAGGMMGRLGGAGAVAGAALGALAVAFAAITAAAGAFAMALGRAIAKMESASLAFKMLAKDGTGGVKTLSKTMQLAADLGLPVDQTVKSMQKLLSMQFDRSTATEILKMGAALRSLGAGQGEVDRVILAMSQIKATGKLQGDELMQLAEAGVSVDLVYRALAKRLGKTKEEVIKLKEAGKIGADLAISAIQDAVKAKGGVSSFDDMITPQMKTISGKWRQVTSTMSMVWLQMVSKASGPLQDVLIPIFDEIVGFMKGAGGEKFGAALSDGIAFVADIIEGVWPLVKGFGKGLMAGFEKMGPAFSQLGGVFQDLFGAGNTDGMVDGFVALGEAVALLASGFALLIGWVAAAVGWLVSLNAASADAGGGISILMNMAASLMGMGDGFLTAGMDLGNALINGLVSGLQGGAQGVIDAITGIAGDAIAQAKAILGINSPSKVFAEIGAGVTDGFVRGVDDTASRAEAAMGAFSATGAGPAAGQLAGGVSGTKNEITIAVDPGAAIYAAEKSKDPQQYAAAVRNMIATSLVDELEVQLSQL